MLFATTGAVILCTTFVYPRKKRFSNKDFDMIRSRRGYELRLLVSRNVVSMKL
jgi:hypothetical protein